METIRKQCRALQKGDGWTEKEHRFLADNFFVMTNKQLTDVINAGRRVRDRTVDHFWPKRLRGRLKVVCCRDCNADKSGLMPPEWLIKLHMRAIDLDCKSPEFYKCLRMMRAVESLWLLVKGSIK